ncbi:MAG: hypothetical protein ACE5GJ_10210 [Gemmatimonadota bacterium]
MRYSTLVLGILSACATSGAVGHLDGQDIPLSLHGFAQINWSVRTTGASPEAESSGDYLLGEERLQLELSHIGGDGRAEFLSKVDLVHDAVSGRAAVDLREAYVDLALGRVGVRVGRQVITWGVGDLLFVSDVFPKDWSAFFSGQTVEYLKLGSDAVSFDLRAGRASLDVVVMPIFRADRRPEPDRFVLPDPFAAAVRDYSVPTAELEHAQVAARVRTRIGGADVALSAHRGYFGMPSARPVGGPDAPASRVLESHPRLDVFAVSLRRPALAGLISAEVGYRKSRDDPAGVDPWVPNSEIRALAGYQRAVGRDGVFGIQYYLESMRNHDLYRATLPEGVFPKGRLRQVLMSRLVRYADYHQWEISAVAFYGLKDGDLLVIPTLRRQFSDELSISLGANVFGGESTTPFGALSENDNLFIAGRYSF